MIRIRPYAFNRVSMHQYKLMHGLFETMRKLELMKYSEIIGYDDSSLFAYSCRITVRHGG